eukprot:6738442-Prymnesium_polylepis.1
MLGSSLSISCSKCAQKTADLLPQSRQWRARTLRSCVCTVARERGHAGQTQGFEPPGGGDSDVAPGGWGPPGGM